MYIFLGSNKRHKKNVFLPENGLIRHKGALHVMFECMKHEFRRKDSVQTLQQRGKSPEGPHENAQTQTIFMQKVWQNLPWQKQF